VREEKIKIFFDDEKNDEKKDFCSRRCGGAAQEGGARDSPLNGVL
jgi:hypothetical protein